MNHVIIIEIIAAITMPLGITGIIWHRAKTGKSLGVRIIQLSCIYLSLPMIFILSLEDKLTSAFSALIGTLFGYILSDISNFDKNKNSDNK